MRGMRSVPEEQRGGCGARSPQLERCLKRVLMALVAACPAARRAGWPQVNRRLCCDDVRGRRSKRSRPQRLHPRGRRVQADRQTAAGGVAAFVWTVACRGGGVVVATVCYSGGRVVGQGMSPVHAAPSHSGCDPPTRGGGGRDACHV